MVACAGSFIVKHSKHGFKEAQQERGGQLVVAGQPVLGWLGRGDGLCLSVLALSP